MSNGREFVGESDANLDAATHNAAVEAQGAHSAEELKEGVWYEIIRSEIKIGNPHITSYRSTITQSGPTG